MTFPLKIKSKSQEHAAPEDKKQGFGHKVVKGIHIEAENRQTEE